MITPEEIARLRELEKKATPGPWWAGKHETTVNKLAKWLGSMAKKHDGLTLWMCGAGEFGADGNEDDIRMPAVTGNGPTSEANMDFIISARNALPDLLDEIERLQADMHERDKSLRLELHTLRFKESQEQRFIWWIWNVYAKNVQELLIQAHKVLLIHSDAFWSLVRNLEDYTEKINDGTYLDVQVSTGVKTSPDKDKQELT